MVPKLNFCPYLVMWWPWPLDLKISQMLNTAQIIFSHWQKLLPCTFEWSYGCKTEFLPKTVPVVTLNFDLGNPKSNQFSVSYHWLYFHPISLNFLHAFWSYYIMEIHMNGWKDSWIEGQKDRQRHKTWCLLQRNVGRDIIKLNYTRSYHFVFWGISIICVWFCFRFWACD